ncbi:MAG: 4-(cytidine 5'-diphospho)-2-C-methyl-D-erythritol kinase [Helicobacter sp.]|nr:4-(cytidine 5'-diphospho)-2-C-methyl-D-erythritol kinase [Helicobacter sp.]
MQQDSFAKVNVFFKITGKKGGYHTLFSRFCKVSSLFDTLSWEQQPRSSGFAVKFCAPFLSHEQTQALAEDSTIHKACRALMPHLNDAQKSQLASTTIVVEKKIPLGSGLGGGSSNAACFLQLAVRALSLSLEPNVLQAIAASVGSDVSFFMHEGMSANVSGIGECVQNFAEDTPQFEVLTPPIFCSTPDVYAHYSREILPHNPFLPKYLQWGECMSVEILHAHSLLECNDLAQSAFVLYPALREYAQDGWFLSGSGSSFFRLKQ